MPENVFYSYRENDTDRDGPTWAWECGAKHLGCSTSHE